MFDQEMVKGIDIDDLHDWLYGKGLNDLIAALQMFIDQGPVVIRENEISNSESLECYRQMVAAQSLYQAVQAVYKFKEACE